MKQNKISKNEDIKSIISLIKWTLLKNKIITIVYSSFLLIAFAFISVPNSRYRVDSISFVLVFTVVAIFFSMIIAVKVFDFLHNKRKVDFYNCIPLSKEKLFIARFISGLLLVFIPFLVATMLAFVAGEPSNDGKEILFLMISIITSYTLLAIMAFCTSTGFNTIFLYLALQAIVPLVALIVELCANNSIPGFLDLSFELYDVRLYLISTMLFTLLYDDVTFSQIFILLLILIIELVICYILCKRRKAENAQNIGYTNSVLTYGLIIVASVVAGIGGSAIATLILNALLVGETLYTLYVFVYVVSSLMICIILIAIIKKSLKPFKRTLGIYGVVLVISAVFLAYTGTGYFGQDIYVPKIEDVKSVTFSVNSASYINSHGESKQYETMNYDTKEDIEKIIDIHDEVVKDLRSTYFYPYLPTGKIFNYHYYEPTGIDTVYIEYELNDGTIVKRQYDENDFYTVDEKENEQFTQKVLTFINEGDYKENTDPLYKMKDINDSEMSKTFISIYKDDFSYVLEDNTKNTKEEIELKRTIIDALLLDIENDENFIPHDNRTYTSKYARNTIRIYASDVRYSSEYIIKDSYTNILQLIEDMNAEMVD